MLFSVLYPEPDRVEGQLGGAPEHESMSRELIIRVYYLPNSIILRLKDAKNNHKSIIFEIFVY